MFQPRSLTIIPPNPDVQIFFHGQLLLRSEDGVTCEVAINPAAINHVLTIEVRTRTVGQPDLINMRHVGPLNFRQPEGLLIEVSNPPASIPAAWKCVTSDTINRESGANPPPDSDFRWLLNLEGPLFHERELNPSVFGTQHLIRLKNGEYFFRTAAVNNSRLEYHRSGGGKAPVTFTKIGTIASASVFLVGDQQIVISWNDDSGPQVLTLQKAANTTYEIYVENTPLYQPAPPESDLPNFDELIEYYRVITEIAAGARFHLPPAIHRGSVAGEEGSPSIPCQVLVLDGPTN